MLTRHDIFAVQLEGKLVVKLAILIAALLFFATDVFAETLTAVCAEPKGRTIGLVRGNQTVDAEEGMTGGGFAITWSGGPNITILSKDALGQSQTTNGTLISFENVDGGQLHFYEPDRGEMWFYTLFVRSRRLLISAHQALPVVVGGGVIGKIMQSGCTLEQK